MSVKSSKLGTCLYEAESSFGETTAFGSPIRLPILDSVDLSGFKQPKIDPARVVQRRNEGTKRITGPQSGSFKTKFHLTGHGGVTSSTAPLTSLATLLGYVLGGSQAGAAGTTVASGSTATVVNTAASATYAAGQMCRIGAGGVGTDARGCGQFVSIASHTTTVMTLLTGVSVAPNAADVIHSCELAFAADSATVTGLRFLLQTGNLSIAAHGCYATDFAIGGLNPGEIPFVEITWSCAWWTFSTATFPSAVSVETFSPAPVAAGSFFLAASGTATRATRNVRDFAISYKLGMAPEMGVNGASEDQTIVACARTPDAITVTWTEDADDATLTPALTALFDANAIHHGLLTLNVVPGAAIGLRFPALYFDADRPVQADKDGLNRIQVTMTSHVSTVTTNDLTLSPFVIGFA